MLADNPGVMPGTASEKRGILRAGARMFAAQSNHRGPKLQVTLRKAYGFGSMVMGMMSFDGQSSVFAWPGVTLGAMGASALSASKHSDDEEAKMLREIELQASYSSAAGLGFDEMIDPRETRNALLDGLERALSVRQEVPAPVARIGVMP